MWCISWGPCYLLASLLSGKWTCKVSSCSRFYGYSFFCWNGCHIGLKLYPYNGHKKALKVLSLSWCNRMKPCSSSQWDDKGQCDGWRVTIVKQMTNLHNSLLILRWPGLKGKHHHRPLWDSALVNGWPGWGWGEWSSSGESRPTAHPLLLHYTHFHRHDAQCMLSTYCYFGGICIVQKITAVSLQFPNAVFWYCYCNFTASNYFWP